MNNRHVIPFVAVLSVFSLLFSSFLKSQDIDTLLTKWENRLKKENLISCDIKQTKKIEFLKDKISLKGKFYYKYPHFFRVEIHGDENFDIYCDGETVSIIDHDLEESEIHDFNSLSSQNRIQQLLYPLIGQTKEDVKNNYDIQFHENTHSYELTPKSFPGSSYRTILFKVDLADRIKWMKIFYKNSDWTETEFSNWKELDKVSDYFFKYLK